MKYLILALLTASQSFGAINLLFDDFNDGSIDPVKWTTDLPYAGSSVTESSGSLTTQTRGLLGTVDSFTGQYSVSGTFTMNDNFEHFKVVLRSDFSSAGGATERSGILVAFSNDGDQLSIQEDAQIKELKSFTLTTGQSYDFEIIDYGTSIAFFVDGAEQLTYISSYSTGDKIGIYSREFAGTSSSIDGIAISTVPEPTMAGLFLGISALIIATKRRESKV